MSDVGGISGDRLKSVIERIERLEEERRSLGEDIKEVYAEAKASGYDVRTIRKVVTLRKVSESDRREQEMILETYMAAIDMV